MASPLLAMTPTIAGVEGALLSLATQSAVKGFWTSAQPSGYGPSIQILASGRTPGVLAPGEAVKVPVSYIGWVGPPLSESPVIDFALSAVHASDTTPVDWSAMKASMKPASMASDLWDALWPAFVAQIRSTWGDYVKRLDENAAYLGRLGQRVVNVADLVLFEFLQADGLSPLRQLAGGVDAVAEAPGLPLVFSRSFGTGITSRYRVGQLGRGWSHNWEYSLAVAPDGTVTVTGPEDRVANSNRTGVAPATSHRTVTTEPLQRPAAEPSR